VRAKRYLKGGLGGLVGFELAGNKEAGRRFIDALQRSITSPTSATRSLAIHPATTTHSQLTSRE
jgi:O-acetylhomoserine (thiol)-lyase